MNKLEEKLKSMIEDAQHIVVFTGAGVSTESGIKDFRSKDGLYNCISKFGVPYETILSHTYFEENPKTFFQFYKEFMINKSAKPNFFHTFFANLEKEKDVTIITQNIDGLHQMAGSKNVIELHGSIYRNYCENCRKEYGIDKIIASSDIPTCDQCGGIIKPDVVLYEEPLSEYSLTKAMIALEKADLLIIAGTSMNVYPAAGLVNYFFGNNIAVINKETLPISSRAKLNINAPVAKTFEDIYK
jgi:NAD-dependent deacetylase